ncbi:MAG: ABC transporter ATP-binding protein [Dehalococcoidia bacterium]
MDSKDLKPYIHCQDLFKIYKIADLEVVALRGLDFEMNPGEIVALVGASGSGKSTLLNILAGYDSPSAGRVFVGNDNLLQISSKELINYRRRKIGFIWQQTGRNLFNYLSAEENIALPMMLNGISQSERDDRVLELMNLVGIESRRKHKPSQLSGGEQQRVAIAVALANSPPLLLADEPTGELDDSTASEIMDLFTEINHKMDTSILIVTHDPDIAYKVHRVVMIRDGKMSMEIRKRTILGSDLPREENTLDQFTLIDASGRIQIPQVMMEELDLGVHATVRIENGEIIISPENLQEITRMEH